MRIELPRFRIIENELGFEATDEENFKVRFPSYEELRASVGDIFKKSIEEGHITYNDLRRYNLRGILRNNGFDQEIR